MTSVPVVQKMIRIKVTLSPENIPPDPENGDEKEFSKRKDDKCEMKLRRKNWILNKGCQMIHNLHTDITSENYDEVFFGLYIFLDFHNANLKIGTP